MCTAFVYYGEDRICGFNMDLPDVMDWKLFMDDESFYVGLRPAIRPELLPEGLDALPEEYLPCSGEFLRIQGVNRNGNFGNHLNVMNFTKAPFTISEDAVPLYSIVDRFAAGQAGIPEIIELLRKKRVVNMPGYAVDLPDVAMHALLSDRAGRILMIEPGNGYAEICDDHAVMSNFPMLILPDDLDPGRFGYYGVDRYETVLSMIKAAGDHFTPAYGMQILEAVKQEQYSPTRISYVYSQNENRVYYTLERDFAHIKTHQFRD